MAADHIAADAVRSKAPAAAEPAPGLTIWAEVAPDLLERAARLHPERPAIDFLGRRWTYAELAASVARVAAGLQARGIGKGDRVGLCLPNTPFFVVAYYAVLRIGAIVVNYNPLYVERELAHQIEDSGTRLMFVIDIPEVHRKVAAIAERVGLETIVMCPLAAALPRPKATLYRLLKRKAIAAMPDDGRHIAYATLLATREAPRPVDLTADDLAVLQYTGGTTGVPKGAMLTHANIVANSAQNVAFDPTRDMGRERVLGVLPLFHVFAMTVVMNYAIEMAAEMILLPRWELKATLKTLVKTKPTIFPAVPTIYAAIAKLAAQEKRDLSCVELCISGGAPLPAEIAETFRALTGARLVEGYGLTETSPCVSCNSRLGAAKDGSVGRPLPGTIVDIRDPVTGSLMPTGERGEVVVRGPQVMKGYWNKPEATADVLSERGVRTGDIGYLDADGFLFIVDRIKDVILCGGYNVYPRVIEDALYQHPDVAEAVAIGIPDSYRGQAPKAFVTLRAGAKATPEILLTFLEDYVSKIELPKQLEIRDTLPKTAVGKLSRKELVAEETAKAA